MKSRLENIDVAKGLGILLVVLGHNRPLTEQVPALHAAVYLFHMPLFFFLSGLTTPAILSGEKLFKRIIGLVKPYVAGILLFLPLQLKQADHPSNDGILQHALWGSGNAIFNTPLWFLTALIGGYLLYSVLTRILALASNHIAVPLIAGSVIAFTYWLMSSQIGFRLLPFDVLNRPLGAPLNLDFAPLIASLLAIGNWWQTTSAKRNPPSALALWMMAVASALAFVLLLASDPALDLNYRAVQSWPVALVCSALGIIFIMVISQLIANSNGPVKPALTWLGQNTLIILVLHAPIQNALTNLLSKRMTVNAILATLISVVLCSALAWLSHAVINRNKHLRSIFYA